jgi:hypothetical protein
VETPAQNILQNTLNGLRDTWKGKSLRESDYIIDQHGLKFGITRSLSVKILKVKLRGGKNLSATQLARFPDFLQKA